MHYYYDPSGSRPLTIDEKINLRGWRICYFYCNAIKYGPCKLPKDMPRSLKYGGFRNTAYDCKLTLR
jgi:hypothetical protein